MTSWIWNGAECRQRTPEEHEKYLKYLREEHAQNKKRYEEDPTAMERNVAVFINGYGVMCTTEKPNRNLHSIIQSVSDQLEKYGGSVYLFFGVYGPDNPLERYEAGDLIDWRDYL